MKYKSELLSELIEKNGHATTKIPHYESECENEFISEVRGAYPKLIDYSGEWLNYANNHVNIGKFPTERVVDVTNARFENVVPYGYKSANLKGSTKYRDIDTGEFLETFEEGRNLELVSVKMPVLTTTGKNLWDNKIFENCPIATINNDGSLTLNGTLNRHWMFKYTIDKGTYSSSAIGNDNGYIHMFWGGGDGFFQTKKPFDIAEQITRDGYIAKGTYDNINIKLQLEQGSTTTSYEPYKSNILSTSEDVTLRGIGDVQDTLDLLTGEKVERVGEVVLDGSEDIIQRNDIQLTDKIAFQINNIFGFNTTYLMPMICNNFNVYYVLDDKELIRPINGSDMIVINISTSKCNDLDSFKVWLSQNPVTVQYQLETESIKTVDLSCLDENNNPTKFKPYEGVMYVQTSSETLPPLLDMEVPVEAISQNIASFI